MFIPNKRYFMNFAPNMFPHSVYLSLFILCLIPTSFSYSSFERLPVPVPGPYSFAFDLIGGGPYTTVGDGRVLKYVGPLIGFVPYAYTSQNRPAKFCDGTDNTSLAQIRGRGLGLGFNPQTGQLYVADAAKGLVVVEPFGGPAQQLVTSADGVPFKLVTGIEVHQEYGTVYFTDASSIYNISQIHEFITNRDMSGRLLKYDPKTKKVTVLLSGLAVAVAVAMSKDDSYLLVTEFNKNRVQKYWLKGPKANSAEVLLNLSGGPGQIIRNKDGDFWVAVNVQSQEPTPTVIFQGQKISGNGSLLQTITFSPQFNATSFITSVKEYNGKLYLGSLDLNYVGVYKI